jgi:alpha-L-fucosidase
MPIITNRAAYHDPEYPIAKGPFEPTWESLIENYVAPDWFRDAKFGIWAHWSAQCVPEAGDWYARRMYLQGHPQYDHHVKHYGHPSDIGFMEIQNLWKAENWNPDDLLDLYKAAGARYFVALANHHDNLDTYASKHHPWNTTRVGPMRDMIAIWAEKARARGLRFGVSNHAAHAEHWMQSAYGYDAEGPRAGERYDAWKLERSQGTGKWWEGLDPQELYTGAAQPMPDGITSAEEARAWEEGVWSQPMPFYNPQFVRNWFRRCKDLIDSYEPDLVYFDNAELPFGQPGLDIAAHFYNSSLARHGKLEAVINSKQLPPDKQGALVEDTERGYRTSIVPIAWQTDTCIGHWHYNRELYEKKGYMSAAKVIQRLCDVVAKNGNLLLSIPLRGDGTIDEDERRIVEDIGSWTQRFGDAIYETRPWRISGEGPTYVTTGQFGEETIKPFTAEDIRFTTKAQSVHALTLGRATGRVSIASLAEGAEHGQGQVESVEIVGSKAPLDFKRDRKGLHIFVPDGGGHEFGLALKISGAGLTEGSIV